MLNSKLEKLSVEIIPLTGRHLIEASAGTGKTFNITRIYLRLLLESRLDVTQILVMTFTRAATEELRGRITGEIRSVLDNWGQFDPDDSFYTSLSKQFSIADVRPILNNALLHLDQAAIFTIHGFCKRVLTQQAFSSGISFDMQMEADTADIELEAVRDWYRSLSLQTDSYKLLTQLWPAPEKFYQAFADVLSTTISIQVTDPQSILESYRDQKIFCLQNMENSKQNIFSELIDTSKQRHNRLLEWEILLQWLKLSNTNDLSIFQSMPKEASKFFHGGRFPKNDVDKKRHLIKLFAPLKKLKEDSKSIENRVQKAKIYQLASTGIATIRLKIIRAKEVSNVMNYDDLINQLANSLTDNEAGNNTLAIRIREQYPVALVDEFQDTDPQQYAILNAIYQTAQNNALYLIGDPKQAIYAFRNGDIFTYLSAKKNTDYQWFMDTNWRSSTAMVNAYNRLFYGNPLQHCADDVFGFDIHYQPVNAAGKTDQTPLLDGNNQAALELIYFPFNENYRNKKSKKDEMNQDFCPVIASWCSNEINHLLNQNISIGEQPLQESDIAVLVRDKKEAAYIQDALRFTGYSSVYLSSHDNVFYSDEARELQLAINGILKFENDRVLVAALSTRFFGCDTQQLFSLQNNDDVWESHQEQFFNLREIWFQRGFMAMALKLLHHNYTPDPRFHERSLTNAIQLLELLQQASQKHKQPEQLLNWLDEQINSSVVRSEAELRLESDANLIRIITQHGSKGLEYPVVFIPFSSRYKDPAKYGNNKICLFKYHHRHTGLANYFIGQDNEITDLYREEAWAETIRLLYVAITRAEHRCYLCATPFANYQLSPLGQTLKLNSESGHIIHENSSFNNLFSKLESLIDTTKKTIHLRQINQIDFSGNRKTFTEAEKQLVTATFSGRIERNWWLSSFSALTKKLPHGGISSPDRDQDDLATEIISSPDALSELRFELTKGAATGNLLHDILEQLDFSTPHWQESMARPLARFSETLDASQQTQLIAWLGSCLDTQLITHPGSQNSPKLCQLGWSDTLRESEFYFPMKQLKYRQLSDLLARHRSLQDKQISSVQLPGPHILNGMMHGYIDLVFQWKDKFYIVDYKSNHLGYQIDDYLYPVLEKNIRDNYYDLQYLIYSLALHRYLKSTITNYHPQKHFGGVYYLYLRGMKAESGNGIFYTPIATELLTELDALFSNSTVSESTTRLS